MEWAERFYALRRGEDCPMCVETGLEDVGFGVRIYSGSVSEAYLQRAAIQRGYTVVIWRGRHVAEPTHLSAEDASVYWLEVLKVARALELHFEPVKTNYDTLGNSLPHLHTHVILRYADDPRPGWPFPFPKGEVPNWPEEELQEDVRALRVLLSSF